MLEAGNFLLDTLSSPFGVVSTLCAAWNVNNIGDSFDANYELLLDVNPVSYHHGSSQDLQISYMSSRPKVQSGNVNFPCRALRLGGGFADIFCGKSRSSHFLVTVKVFERMVLSRADDLAVRSEAAILQLLNSTEHPNSHIVVFHDYFKESMMYYLVTENVLSSELLWVLGRSKTKFYNEGRIRYILLGIIKAIAHCHENDIIHRNICPESIFILGGNVKVGGFEKALRTENDATVTGVCGCPYFRAPEMHQSEGYGKSVDLWAIGVLFFLLVTGSLPFEKGQTAASEAIRDNSLLTVNSKHPLLGDGGSLSPLGLEILTGLLTKSVSIRTTSEDILASDWDRCAISILSQQDLNPILPSLLSLHCWRRWKALISNANHRAKQQYRLEARRRSFGKRSGTLHALKQDFLNLKMEWDSSDKSIPGSARHQHQTATAPQPEVPVQAAKEPQSFTQQLGDYVLAAPAALAESLSRTLDSPVLAPLSPTHTPTNTFKSFFRENANLDNSAVKSALTQSASAAISALEASSKSISRSRSRSISINGDDESDTTENSQHSDGFENEPSPVASNLLKAGNLRPPSMRSGSSTTADSQLSRSVNPLAPAGIKYIYFPKFLEMFGGAATLKDLTVVQVADLMYGKMLSRQVSSMSMGDMSWIEFVSKQPGNAASENVIYMAPAECYVCYSPLQPFMQVVECLYNGLERKYGADTVADISIYFDLFCLPLRQLQYQHINLRVQSTTKLQIPKDSEQTTRYAQSRVERTIKVISQLGSVCACASPVDDFGCLKEAWAVFELAVCAVTPSINLLLGFTHADSKLVKQQLNDWTMNKLPVVLSDECVATVGRLWGGVNTSEKEAMMSYLRPRLSTGKSTEKCVKCVIIDWVSDLITSQKNPSELKLLPVFRSKSFMMWQFKSTLLLAYQHKWNDCIAPLCECLHYCEHDSVCVDVCVQHQSSSGSGAKLLNKNACICGGPDHPHTLACRFQLAHTYIHLKRYADAEEALQPALDAAQRCEGQSTFLIPSPTIVMEKLIHLFLIQDADTPVEPRSPSVNPVVPHSSPKPLLPSRSFSIRQSISAVSFKGTDNGTESSKKRFSFKVSNPFRTKSSKSSSNLMDDVSTDDHNKRPPMILVDSERDRYNADPNLSNDLEIDEPIVPFNGQPIVVTKAPCVNRIQNLEIKLESMLRALLERQIQTHGVANVNTLRTLHTLALHLRKMRRFRACESLFVQCLEVSTGLFGSMHPTTVMLAWQTAVVFEELGEWKTAETHFGHVVAACMNEYGPEHAKTVRVAAKLHHVKKGQN